MHSRDRWFSVVRGLLCLAVLACSTAARAGWKVTDEHWYEVMLDDKACGWMSVVEKDDGSNFKTTTETQIVFRRESIAVNIRLLSEFEETHSGEPVHVRFFQSLSNNPVETHWDFKDGKILRSNGVDKDEIPIPAGDWLTPHEVSELTKERRDAGAKEISYSTMDPQFGVKVVQFHSKYEKDDVLMIDGREVSAGVWSSQTEVMPGMVAREWWSKDGTLVQQIVNAGFGPLTTRLTSKEVALAVRVGVAPEIMVKSFVKPDRRIERAHQATTLKLRLTAREGDMPNLPSAGAQTAVRNPDGSVELTIDIRHPLPATESEQADAAFLLPSGMVDFNNEFIQTIAPRAIREVADGTALQKVDAIRQYTYRHITKKGLEQAFAPASETAQSQEGDCSEHAVLACALLRANKIPARVACGLVFADEFAGKAGIFGWHMWTQALVDGKWIDLDATLDRRYSAAHILTGTAALTEGPFDPSMTNIITLMGNLNIEVLEVGYD